MEGSLMVECATVFFYESALVQALSRQDDYSFCVETAIQFLSQGCNLVDEFYLQVLVR